MSDYMISFVYIYKTKKFCNMLIHLLKMLWFYSLGCDILKTLCVHAKSLQ